VNLNSVIDLVMTPHRFGDRTLGGSCEKVDGAVMGCGAGGVGHGMMPVQHSGQAASSMSTT
jgi:hypothetical protein